MFCGACGNNRTNRGGFQFAAARLPWFELNAKQREVLARRFGLLGYEAATLEDVGREIGLTRERVRQIQVEGLRRLREILQTQGLNIEALFRE
ncbi:hypothetical protein BLX45_23865 [Salmonella enterica subsp. enterica serovar Typhimurium]|nr:hypothetical protein BLX45_23865 [Salmonella enterica subsp. enterica serovar Typhimurium]